MGEIGLFFPSYINFVFLVIVYLHSREISWSCRSPFVFLFSFREMMGIGISVDLFDDADA